MLKRWREGAEDGLTDGMVVIVRREAQQCKIARAEARPVLIDLEYRFNLVCSKRSIVAAANDNADAFFVAERNDYPAAEEGRTQFLGCVIESSRDRYIQRNLGKFYRDLVDS